MGLGSATGVEIEDDLDATRDVRVPLGGVQRLLVATLLAGFGYWLLTWGARSYCFEGTDATSCVALALSPSPVMLVVLGAVVLLALSRARSHAHDPAATARLFDRVAMITVLIALVGAAFAHAWFWLIPVEQFHSGSFGFLVPFPIGLIEATID